MAHERHTHLLQDPRLHAPRVERMAQIVEPYVADFGVAERGRPGAFYDTDGLAVKLDHEPLRLAVRR